MAPFIKSNNKTRKIMLNLLLALIPIILFAIYKNGIVPYIHGKTDIYGLFYPLIFVLIGTFTSFFVELIYYKIIKRAPFKDKYSIFPGLFLSLLLPFKIPIYALIIGASVASISKIIFGGFGKNIFNPALIGYVFVVACYGAYFTTNYYFNNYELDTISSATPLTNASMVSGIGEYSSLVKPYGGLKNFFLGMIPGGMGEVSSILCLAALVYLTATKTIKWRIPIAYLSTVFLITFSIGRLLGQGMYYPLFHLFSGGLMFGAIFMATDPVTSCVTPIGQVFQGIFLGILTVILRFMNVEGVATSILFMNMLVFIFDNIGVKVRFDFMKSLIWIIITFVITILVIILLSASRRKVGDTDPNFKIISKDKNGIETVYVVTQKGYGGNIKGKITMENGVITEVEILSNHETKDKYQMVINSNYIQALIKEQNNLASVDTVSGATVTSSALKKMIINVIEDYK